MALSHQHTGWRCKQREHTDFRQIILLLMLWESRHMAFCIGALPTLPSDGTADDESSVANWRTLGRL